jgi:ribosomal protein L16 Arg81 hydroxylase
MPNKYNREMQKKYTPEELKEMRRKQAQQQLEDDRNYPELFNDMYDSYGDKVRRKKGISPLSKETRDYIRRRYESNEYPERLEYLVLAELNLKDPE